MQKRSRHNTDGSPIIGRVTLLIKSFVRMTKDAPKEVKHPFCDRVNEDLILLYKYSIREVNGKDYKKRCIDILEEIHAEIYLIYALEGLSKKHTMLLDMDVNAILDNICHGQSVFGMAYRYSNKGICENNRKIYLRNLNRRFRERKKRMFNL